MGVLPNPKNPKKNAVARNLAAGVRNIVQADDYHVEKTADNKTEYQPQ
jgi:hypothetical protein